MSIIDVIIPAWKPGSSFLTLLEELEKQNTAPNRIIIVNTEERYFKELEDQDTEGILQRYDNILVKHVTKRDFDHGATRNYGVQLSDADYFLMMTQDAMPRDHRLISELFQALDGDESAVAAYAKQYPAAGCSLGERYLRKFNYPSEPMRKTQEDLPRLGIKTYFCSNVCAMYRRSLFDALGGFASPSVFNEDMVFAGTAMQKGYAVHYVPDAGVIHSHNYTWMQQFRRNFDIGASQVMHPEIFAGISSEETGKRMVKETIAHFREIGKNLEIPHYIMMCGARFLGYRLGRSYEKLPRFIIRGATMNPTYWERVWSVKEERVGICVE